jgi:hypothetical protein
MPSRMTFPFGTPRIRTVRPSALCALISLLIWIGTITDIHLKVPWQSHANKKRIDTVKIQWLYTIEIRYPRRIDNPRR